MTPHEFKAKWSTPSGNERQTYQEHFADLCDLLGVDKPSAADRANLDYTFEKQVDKAAGGTGAADVWKRGFFGWEYKAKESDLPGAYVQLLGYMNALENPPLLIVSDTKLIRIYPTFPNQKTVPIDIPISRITDEASLDILTRVFTDPMSFRDADTAEAVTRVAAEKFGAIATALQSRGAGPHAVAHFLVQLLFCLFAEDTGILPKGLFGKVLSFGARVPAQFTQAITELMSQMAEGGYFWGEEIPHVNGGLFREITPIPLDQADLATLADAAKLNWSKVEPAIFGTLFERSLDPNSRAKLGTHYTGKPDILRVVEPVVMAPLRRRWTEVKIEAEPLAERWQALPRGRAWNAARDAFAEKLRSFRDELKAVRILDPACGSGNFLYIALENLLELENEVIAFGVERGLSGQWPEITPEQLLGLEINEYARELAQVVIWIGYLQWMIGHGFGFRQPVLDPLETIRLQDALLDRTDPEHPKEAEWPKADYIIGNPPFLGGKRIRAELGDENVDDLFSVYDVRVPREADLCCYFFEKARQQVEANESHRAGLLATNSIRGGANREVLKRIKQTGEIYLAWSDEPWILDGAAVRISIVGFDDGTEKARLLDGKVVPLIGPDLTATIDVSSASRLPENFRLAFMGDTMGGPFNIHGDLAQTFLSLPINPNGRPNSDVVRPRANGHDLLRRPRDEWVIDFGAEMPEQQAALYEAPFEYVRQHVKPIRDTNRRESYRLRWWLHVEPRAGLRAAMTGLDRYLVTTIHARHRIFSWLAPSVLPDHALIAFAREDDYFFGVLHSRAHEVWSLRMGTSLEDRPRYTPTTCFETFPLPWPPGQEPTADPRVQAIAAAAKELDRLRSNWLYPPDCPEAELKKRTLTNLYNQRPAWLQLAHDQLDRAVWAAYGWEDDPTETMEEEILRRLLELNGQRRAVAPSSGWSQDATR
jgi:type II restriction/modification system DNA methylase subunit YeeA